ncbi:rhomboid family intramembrane serine protease [Aeoliella mucimassa]|uniref:Rhomboid family protein n=1 Tax=Aeoliella mucimassa TaxID=2527972 RepID=A0A518AID5_9BACT|nr:rhomboid family intramembrane serine protease [Aeoliella mucimassa]QDU54487.1 Rhomboid family protein [Aeoliella mucimassa]
MGLNERDYGRASYEGSYGYGQSGYTLGSPQSVVVKLIIINAIVFVLQLIFRSNDPRIPSNFDSLFSLHEHWYYEPWRFFELLSYGFLHSPWDYWHIFGNMFMLWFAGRAVEQKIGGREFLVFYLLGIVIAGTAWCLIESMVPDGGNQRFGPLGVPMLGASGGVTAVLMLFIFYYPRVTILFMFVIPMPAWVLGVLVVGGDMWGAMSRSGHVAFTAHLGGALFAYLYYNSRIRLTDYVPTSFKMPSFKRKPPLRVHRPDDEPREDAQERRLNELLDKVSKHGQDSLSKREFSELQKLSKHYQQKRK